MELASFAAGVVGVGPPAAFAGPVAGGGSIAASAGGETPAAASVVGVVAGPTAAGGVAGSWALGLLMLVEAWVELEATTLGLLSFLGLELVSLQRPLLVEVGSLGEFLLGVGGCDKPDLLDCLHRQGKDTSLSLCQLQTFPSLVCSQQCKFQRTFHHCQQGVAWCWEREW